MQPLDFLYLSQEDVVKTGITIKKAVEIVEQVLIEHGLNYYENPPKPGIHTKDNAFIHAMPAYLKRIQAAGMKWVSGYSDNPGKGLPSIMGLIVLNDVDTGQPLAVMDAAFITALRTAAVSGVAAKYLAGSGSETLGIVGAGVQGRYHLSALKEVLPNIKSVKFYDIHKPALESCVNHFDNALPFNVTAADSIEETIKDSDVVVTATGSLDRVIYMAEWIKQGALILPVHMYGWERAAILDSDKFIVDDWEQFSSYMNDHKAYYTPLPEPWAELGKIVAGQKSGRTGSSERIINFNLGIAIHDIAFANEIFINAQEKKIGTKLELMKELPPFSI